MLINKPIIAIVIPCFNEEDILLLTAGKLFIKMKQLINNEVISDNSKIIFIDDGSNDNTWN